jgi:hypothetical protein
MLRIKIQEVSMRVGPILIVSAFVLCAHSVSAQSLLRYRDYALGTNVASVLKITGGRESDVKTTRQRPAMLREIEWQAPYVTAVRGQAVDPVHDIAFSFYNDQLYRIAVSYSRGRVEGLTGQDFIDSLSASYGAPTRDTATRGGSPASDHVDATVIARWEDTDSRLTLERGTYSGQFQVVLISKPLNDSMRAALTEGARLDALEAPQRAVDQRKQEAADNEKTREANKAGFRP